MTLYLRQKPIYEWPGSFTRDRRGSQFSASYADTLALLEREINHLNAQKVFLKIVLQPQDFRLDGAPRAAARPSHPGVILTFDTRQGTMTFPCDTFTDWQSNLRAIAKGLEALRAVDRYGITSRQEQYRGWTALPAPESTPSGFASKEEAAMFIVDNDPDLSSLKRPRADRLYLTIYNRTMRAAYYRRAAAKLHPDAGGDKAQFQRLQKAKEMLEL